MNIAGVCLLYAYLRHIFPFGPICEVLVDIISKMVEFPPWWYAIGPFIRNE